MVGGSRAQQHAEVKGLRRGYSTERGPQAKPHALHTDRGKVSRRG